MRTHVSEASYLISRINCLCTSIINKNTHNINTYSVRYFKRIVYVCTGTHSYSYLETCFSPKEVYKSNFQHYGQMKSKHAKSQKKRSEEKVREEKRRSMKRKSEKVRSKKIQVREKTGKSRNTVFFEWFVAPEGRKVGSLKRRCRASWPDER